jgi:hypothetical protein
MAILLFSAFTDICFFGWIKIMWLILYGRYSPIF